MRKAHHYPLTAEALADYCHPRPGHTFHRPLRWNGGLAACNGWMAIHITKGAWLDAEHPEAADEALERLGRLPWSNHFRLPAKDGWTTLDDHSSTLFKYGEKPLWSDSHAIIPSALWNVADVFVTRLSILQLVARLPSAQIYPPSYNPGHTCPMAFRCTGGVGLIAPTPHTPGHTPTVRFLKPRTEIIL